MPGHLGLGEVALRLGEPGAGVGADGAAPAGDEVLGRRDGRARGEQRLVPRGGGAAARGLRVAGGDEAAVEGGVGFVDEPQRGHRVGGRGVLRGGRRGQRGLGARDEPGELARRPARFARGQQGAGFGDVLFGLGAGRRDAFARGRELGAEPADAVEQRLGLRHRLLGRPPRDDRRAPPTPLPAFGRHRIGCLDRAITRTLVSRRW